MNEKLPPLVSALHSLFHELKKTAHITTYTAHVELRLDRRFYDRLVTVLCQEEASLRLMEGVKDPMYVQDVNFFGIRIRPHE